MPTQAAEHVSSYKVSIGGSPIGQQIADQIREIRVLSSLGTPDVCTLKLLFSLDHTKANDIDKQPFALGKELEVRLGATDDRQPSKKLFSGDVVTLEPSFSSGGGELLVRALDPAHKLFRARHVRTFQNQKASDVVVSVCREAGLQVVADDSSVVHDYLQQVNETDWDFARDLADRIGFELVVVDGVVNFRKPGRSGNQVALTYMKDLFSFSPRLSAVQQVGGVDVRSYDPKRKEPIVARSKTPRPLAEIGYPREKAAKALSGAANARLLVATEPVAKQASAQQVADALAERMAAGYATAEGSTFGNPEIKAGTIVTIKGVGSTFGGKYRVQTATHVLRGGGTYETRFSSGSDFTLSGALGGGAGHGVAASQFTAEMAIGRVTNNKDPDGMGRVKVKFPALGDSVESFWCRVVVPSAGNQRGLSMLPVIDEEVLVAFEHGDITRAYVVGSLFNGKDKPGEVLAAEDGSFGLRSDEKVVTNSKKATELTSEDTFSITSTKAMTVDSKDALDVHATKAATFKSDQSAEISGTQSVKVSSTGQITIDAGSAGSVSINAMNIKLSASGMVQISGSTVMLG